MAQGCDVDKVFPEEVGDSDNHVLLSQTKDSGLSHGRVILRMKKQEKTFNLHNKKMFGNVE
jgi:hypothetical protein